LKARITSLYQQQSPMHHSADALCELIESQDPSNIAKHGGIDSILSDLSTDPKAGLLDPSTLPARVHRYGSNEIPDLPVRSFFGMLKEALSDETLIILMVCAVVSLVLELILAPPGERAVACIDGGAILAAVAIVSLVQAYSNHKQELQFAAVNRIKAVFDVTVIRQNFISQLKNTELVVGDIVLLEQGNKIPADGLCVESDGLLLDQSSANGESEAVFKGSHDPFLICGTYVTDGRGKMVVLCVGEHSNQGRIFGLIAEETSEETPLQEKLAILAKKIGYSGMFAAAAIFAVLMFGWVLQRIRLGWELSAFKHALNYLIVSITIVAVAVPEGLPLAVTISLAYSMRQMMNDNNFVRHLSACETMGSATVICTDKTGTLTKNEMNVEHLILGTQLFWEPPRNDFLLRSISVNSHAVIGEGRNIGSQTECALLRFVTPSVCASHRNSAKIVKCFQFDRIRKRMSTVEQVSSGFVVHVKGAPDEVLPNCTTFVSADGETVPITDDFRNTITGLVNAECSSSYRTLAVAGKSADSCPLAAEEAERDLCLMGICSIRDSLRRNTVRSIRNCQSAGIRVVMVTGDHMLTAQAIADECHLIRDDSLAITGAELRKMSQAELEQVLPHIAVVARSTPMDKHLLVTALKEAGHVVSVTGDGTNDVPALIAADVGLSMGKCGTELAKEASDIVVLDDDFKSIERSVIWGRSVYNNSRRFLQYQLTANVATLFISFLAAVILEDTPFQAVQLLWVNLIMDSFGALALATGRPHESLLDQKPYSRETPLISTFMWASIVGQSLLQIGLIACILLYPFGLVPHSQHHYTLLYNVFVLCQAFNLVNARATCPGDDPTVGMLDPPLYFGIMCGIPLVQIVLVQLFGEWFSATPLGFSEWILSFGLAALTLPVGALLRKINTLLAGQKHVIDSSDDVPLVK
jgi:Ca2+-transporting ATPase